MRGAAGGCVRLDDRAAARRTALIPDPGGGFVENRNVYMQAVDGMAFGSSRAQGVVRDNRFYHAHMVLTMAFPHGWTIENQRDRILAYSQSRDSLLQIAVEPKPDNKAPREYLIAKLKSASLAGGEPVTINGMDGYVLQTRSGSPLDNGAGPVRYIVLYRGKSAFVFGGVSRSARNGRPEADGLFRSVAETMRDLDYAADIPVEKYHTEELELINGVYPKKPLSVGEYVKVVE